MLTLYIKAVSLRDPITARKNECSPNNLFYRSELHCNYYYIGYAIQNNMVIQMFDYQTLSPNSIKGSYFADHYTESAGEQRSSVGEQTVLENRECGRTESVGEQRVEENRKYIENLHLA